MDPRLRRLKADYEQVMTTFSEHFCIRVVSAEGNPAETYVIEYQLVGLVPDGEESFQRGEGFRAEIHLLLDYPRRPPFCRMLTPVFHPNIDAQKICIGDHWSAGQRLADLIVRIGEMITYQSYNTKSPLNGRAAAWAEANPDQLPLEMTDLTQGL